MLYQLLSMCQCVNVSMCQCVIKCVNVSMCQCVNVSMCQCVNVSMCQCVNVSMCQCVNVLISLQFTSPQSIPPQSRVFSWLMWDIPTNHVSYSSQERDKDSFGTNAKLRSCVFVPKRPKNRSGDCGAKTVTIMRHHLNLHFCELKTPPIDSPQ